MGYRRHVVPTAFLSGAAATAAYVAIGMRLAATRGEQEPNIEDTLLAASLEGTAGDYRVLSLLTDWLSIHSSRVNVDRLVRLINLQESPRLKAYWSATAKWLKKDVRFARVQRLYTAKALDLLATGNDFVIERHGLDDRFAGSSFKVPLGTLRRRETDIASPSELSKQHTPYRWRVLIGPTYRADMWAALERDPQLSPAALARCTYGSFATAWQVKTDWLILHADRPA